MQARNVVQCALLDFGVARMVNCMELHLLHMQKLTLAGKDHPALAEVLLWHQGVFDYPHSGLPPDHGIELCLKTGNLPMQQSHPVKQLSAGELIKLNCQLHNLYERCWIKRSTLGHTVAVVFVGNPDGLWCLCYDYRGLNAITEPPVEPLQHIDTLLEQTRG